MKKRILSPLGRILVFSFIHAAPEGLEQLGPYPIALVKLDDGPTILTQITDYDPSTLSEGQRVQGVFRKLFAVDTKSVIQYGIKFRPVVF
ncbi:MAG TPA: OB-fold domain-containing protein [Patescibacteria group bacterium]|nr:OB-fold domain-containing protein [Patescibacteria group bacterium]